MSLTIHDLADRLFKDKAFLTVEDVARLLDCPDSIVYNWTKRPNPKQRPPRVAIGRSFRFPRPELIQWLMTQQMIKTDVE